MGFITNWMIKRRMKQLEKQIPDVMNMLKSFTDHDPFEDIKNDK